MKYLVRRTYKFTAEEWVDAGSERDAKNAAPTENEERNYDDHWDDSEVIETKDDDSQ